VADQAKETAGQIAHQAREKVTSQVGGQKDRMAQQIGSVAHALRQSGQQMRDQQQDLPVEYIDQVADQVERFSQYLQKRDLNQLIGEVERFAWRQPTLFLGGAFMLGLLGARFLKSSSQQRAEMYGYSDYYRSGYGRSFTGAGVYNQGRSGMATDYTSHYADTSSAMRGQGGTGATGSDSSRSGTTSNTRYGGDTEGL
jgi:glucan phosphorylase